MLIYCQIVPQSQSLQQNDAAAIKNPTRCPTKTSNVRWDVSKSTDSGSESPKLKKIQIFPFGCDWTVEITLMSKDIFVKKSMWVNNTNMYQSKQKTPE